MHSTPLYKRFNMNIIQFKEQHISSKKALIKSVLKIELLLSVRPALTHLQIPKNNSSSRYGKTLVYGASKMIYCIYRVISDLHPRKNWFCQRNFSFWKYVYALRRPWATCISLQLFLGNCKCTSTGITSSLRSQRLQNCSGYLRGLFLLISWEGLYQLRIFFFYSHMLHYFKDFKY